MAIDYNVFERKFEMQIILDRSEIMFPTVDFFGRQVTRMIIGDNPVNGHSYIADQITGVEMSEYYTQSRVVELLFEVVEAGYNTILPIACPKIFGILREFRSKGGKINIIFQPYPRTPLAENIEEMREFDPIGTYHQGSVADYLIETGNEKQLFENLEILKKSGFPVGYASHDPGVVLRAEEEGWGMDFYMTCLYNMRRNRKGQQSGFITGETKAGVVYGPEDRLEMLEVIKKVKKPCIAYKLLAGGQALIGLDAEAREATITRLFKETYENIKSTDIACIAVFQRDADQLAQDTRILKSILM